MDALNEIWQESVASTVASHRRIIDAAISQLTDDELQTKPAPEINSVAVILRHLGGNLRSRWTDFLTTDGEKPDRDRDREFEDWDGDRASLMQYFDAGWACLEAAAAELTAETTAAQIEIRGEPHSVPLAMLRSLTHVAYHVGQIVMVARMVHDGPWNWLTIAPGGSQQHNERTWGTVAARSAYGVADGTASPSPGGESGR